MLDLEKENYLNKYLKNITILTNINYGINKYNLV